MISQMVFNLFFNCSTGSGQRAVAYTDAATGHVTGGGSGESGVAAGAVLLATWTPAETTTKQPLVAPVPSAPRVAQAPPGLPSASLPRHWSVPGAPLPGPGCGSCAETTAVLPPAASDDVDAAAAESRPVCRGAGLSPAFAVAVMPGLNYSMSLSFSS